MGNWDSDFVDSLLNNMNVDKLSQRFFVFKFVCNEFYFLYVSWMHEKSCFIISFQIIRKNLISFRNRIAYFGTNLRKKKYLIIQLCILSLTFQFHLQ